MTTNDTTGASAASSSAPGEDTDLACARANPLPLGLALAPDEEVHTIKEHLGNIHAEGALSREATIRKSRIVGAHEIASCFMRAPIAISMWRLLSPSRINRPNASLRSCKTRRATQQPV